MNEEWERERGAASIMVLSVGLFLVGSGLAGAALGTAQVGRHRAQAAADLGALAGAAEAVFGADAACARAELFVIANRGRLMSCTVDGLEIVVRVAVPVRPLGRIRQAEAAARAGPVYAAAD